MVVRGGSRQTGRCGRRQQSTPKSPATTMIPDIAYELSAEQLIVVLNKKLSMEFPKLQPMMPTATLVAEVCTTIRRGTAKC